MDNHCDSNDLAGYIEGAIPPLEGQRIEQHLRVCPRCLEAVAVALATLSRTEVEPPSARPPFLDAVLSAIHAPRLALARSRDGLRIDSAVSTQPRLDGVFGSRFSIGRLLQTPVLPNTVFQVAFESGAFHAGEFIPGPGSVSIRLQGRPEVPLTEVEVHSDGALLRNTYVDREGVFVLDRLPDQKTLYFRDARTGESHLVLQTYAVVFDSRDYAKLGIYLASQGLLDEAAEVFETYHPVGEFGRKLARVYKSLRYCAVLYPAEVALLRGRNGRPQTRNTLGPVPLPVYARLAARLAEGEARLTSDVRLREGIQAGLDGDWARAADCLGQAGERPWDADLAAALGWSLLLSGRTTEALSQFRGCLLTNPDHGDALTGLGFLQHMLEREDKAKTAEDVLTEFLENASSLIADAEGIDAL